MADWRSDLLDAIGAPRTAHNLDALNLWARSEGIATSLHNPLGAGEWNPERHEWFGDHFVQRYVGIDGAVRDYAALLRDPSFQAIAQALRGRFSLEGIWRAIHFSPWREESYQSHRYPVMLWRKAVAPPLGFPAPDVPVSQLTHDIGAAWHRLSRELHHHSARQAARAKHWSGRLHSAVR